MLGNVLRSDQTGSVYQRVQKVPLAMFAYRTTVSNVTGVTPFKGVFGVDSRVPLDVIFPPPPAAAKQWPEYVRDQQQQMQSIYQEMRANGRAAIGRATAYQTGRVTCANRVEVGDVVYYFSPRVTRDADNRLSKKLALLWRGPYRVVGKPSESLATLQPMGHWSRGGANGWAAGRRRRAGGTAIALHHQPGHADRCGRGRHCGACRRRRARALASAERSAGRSASEERKRASQEETASKPRGQSKRRNRTTRQGGLLTRELPASGWPSSAPVRPFPPPATQRGSKLLLSQNSPQL